MSDSLPLTRDQVVEYLSAVSATLSALPDDKIMEFLPIETLRNFLTSIFDADHLDPGGNIQEYLLENKKRSIVAAVMHRIYIEHCTFSGTSPEGSVLIYPTVHQWFDDGVMYLAGESNAFSGMVALYRDGEVSYAHAAADVKKGGEIGPHNMVFVHLEEAKRIRKRGLEISQGLLSRPIDRLSELLDEKCNEESAYQELLESYPWALGAQYKSISRHTKLDDENVPDFTGVRSHDSSRDIFEIKPPFARLFNKDGEFSAEFHSYWGQAERYLSFVRRNGEYLSREKGLRFETPECWLILGYDLTDDQRLKIQQKQGMVPGIRVLTFNELHGYMKVTAETIRNLKLEDISANVSDDSHVEIADGTFES